MCVEGYCELSIQTLCQRTQEIDNEDTYIALAAKECKEFYQVSFLLLEFLQKIARAIKLSTLLEVSCILATWEMFPFLRSLWIGFCGLIQKSEYPRKVNRRR